MYNLLLLWWSSLVIYLSSWRFNYYIILLHYNFSQFYLFCWNEFLVYVFAIKHIMDADWATIFGLQIFVWVLLALKLKEIGIIGAELCGNCIKIILCLNFTFLRQFSYSYFCVSRSSPFAVFQSSWRHFTAICLYMCKFLC